MISALMIYGLCDKSGDPDQYCKKTLYFCDFSVGLGSGLLLNQRIVSMLKIFFFGLNVIRKHYL